MREWVSVSDTKDNTLESTDIYTARVERRVAEKLVIPELVFRTTTIIAVIRGGNAPQSKSS